MLDGAPKYPAYKDSGEVWLGDIPADWELESIRAVTELKSKRGQPDWRVLSVYRDYGVIPKDSRDDNHNATSLDTSNYKVVEPGDLVVNKMKAWQGSMGVSEHSGIVSPAYITCRTDPDKVVPRFLHYTLRSQPFIAVYNSLSYGVRIGQWDMHYDDFKKIPLAYPDLATQNRIVGFLDEKTAEIDAAIAKKRRLIDLLNEQKTILINRAVTKGLNPDAPMKDSGVDWIGEIPAHWEVKQVKRCITESEYGLSDSTDDDGKFRCLGMGHIVDGKVTEAKAGYLDKVPPQMFLQAGDILFNRTNSFDLVGKSGLYSRTPEQPETFASYLVRLRTADGHSSEWLNFLLSDAGFLSFIRSLALRSLNQANLNPNRMMRVHIPVPEYQEQMAIVRHLSELSADNQNALGKINDEISTLNEFKQTLVANAVTGKIKI